MTKAKAGPGKKTAPEVETIDVDLNTLTLKELKAIEDIAGREDFQQLLEGRPTVSCMVGLAYVMRRKTDPGFTVDDAWELPLDAVAGGVSTEADPT